MFIDIYICRYETYETCASTESYISYRSHVRKSCVVQIDPTQQTFHRWYISYTVDQYYTAPKYLGNELGS